MTTAIANPWVTYTLPQSGLFYVGDPSYVLNDDDYESLVADESVFKTGITTLHGYNMFILGDGPGDGFYPLDDLTEVEDNPEVKGKYSFGVDSGNWAIIPLELLTDLTEDELWKYGFVIDSTAVDFGSDEDGNQIEVFDVDVTYQNGCPKEVEFLGYKVTIFED